MGIGGCGQWYGRGGGGINMGGDRGLWAVVWEGGRGYKYGWG